jgi:hypothetical protein
MAIKPTPEQMEEYCEIITYKVEQLVAFANSVGLNFEVTRRPAQPLATGNHKPGVQIWLKREFTRPE